MRGFGNIMLSKAPKSRNRSRLYPPDHLQFNLNNKSLLNKLPAFNNHDTRIPKHETNVKAHVPIAENRWT